MSKKWTNEKRELTFKAVLNKYGMCTDKNNYINVLTKDKEFLNNITTSLNNLFNTNIKENGVLMQIRWALQKSNSALDAGHAQNFILNKAIAKEVGLIDSSLMPKGLLPEY